MVDDGGRGCSQSWCWVKCGELGDAKQALASLRTELDGARLSTTTQTNSPTRTTPCLE